MLTDTQKAALATELERPEYAEARQASDLPAVLAILNAPQPDVTVTEPVPQRTILKQLMVLGKLKPLYDAADAGNPAAWNTREVLRHPAFAERPPDLFDPASQGMLGALVQTNILTGPERATIEALARRPVSRAEQILGREAQLPDLWEVLHHG